MGGWIDRKIKAKPDGRKNGGGGEWKQNVWKKRKWMDQAKNEWKIMDGKKKVNIRKKSMGNQTDEKRSGRRGN